MSEKKIKWKKIPAKRINFLSCFLFPATCSPGMFDVPPVARLLAGCPHRPRSSRVLRPSWWRPRNQGTSMGLGVGQSAAAAGGKVGTLEVLSGVFSQGLSPDPKMSGLPSSFSRARPYLHPAPHRRGGTFPTGSDPVQSGGTGAPQPVCQENPSGCTLGVGGGG